MFDLPMQCLTVPGIFKITHNNTHVLISLDPSTGQCPTRTANTQLPTLLMVMSYADGEYTIAHPAHGNVLRGRRIQELDPFSIESHRNILNNRNTGILARARWIYMGTTQAHPVRSFREDVYAWTLFLARELMALVFHPLTSRELMALVFHPLTSVWPSLAY